MARLTVEDCLPYVSNRFDLVLLASKRARQVAFGSKPLVQEEHDKPAVIALREIAKGAINSARVSAIEAKEQGEEPLEPTPGLKDMDLA